MNLDAFLQSVWNTIFEFCLSYHFGEGARKGLPYFASTRGCVKLCERVSDQVLRLHYLCFRKTFEFLRDSFVYYRKPRPANVALGRSSKMQEKIL
jgi:hypothetical protein